MNFHDVRFPENLSFGSSGGPERRTEIVTLSNGFEERNTPWAHSRRRYDAGMGMRSLDDLGTLIAFFQARQGQLFGFRWKDWTDYKSCILSDDPDFLDQPLGEGDGEKTRFQLCRTYRSGEISYHRPVIKPVMASVSAGISGDKREIDVDFTVDYQTGWIEFAVPPEIGATITAGFEFDVPVRFDTDRIVASVASFSAGEIPDVPIVEVRV